VFITKNCYESGFYEYLQRKHLITA